MTQIHIGSRSFIEAKQLAIENSAGSSSLTLTIGDDSFTSASLFKVSQGQSLSSLQLGNESFAECDDFIIDNPVSVQSVMIGYHVGGRSPSFVLNGVRRFIVGAKSFSEVTSFSLGNSTVGYPY